MIVPNSPEHLELMALDARVDDAIAELHKVKRRIAELRRGAGDTPANRVRQGMAVDRKAETDSPF